MKEVVVGIISKKDKEGRDLYLFVSTNVDFGEYTGFYYLPGGHVENGESEESALIRKITGELRVIVNPIRKVATTVSDVPGEIIHWWLCDHSPPSESIAIKDPNVTDIAWFSEDEIKQRKDIFPANKPFFQKYIFKS